MQLHGLELIYFIDTGEQTIENSLTLYPLNHHTSAATETDQLSPIEVDMKVSTDKPFLQEDDKDHGWVTQPVLLSNVASLSLLLPYRNILFVRVKGLYSLPDGLAATGAHTFTVATPSPSYLVWIRGNTVFEK